MYIIDFFTKIMKKGNIPVLCYLALNVVLICGAVKVLLADGALPLPLAILIGLLLYSASLAVALSPVGEWILRLQTGCREIVRSEHLERLGPIFNRVYAQARAVDPTIAEDVRLYMNDDPVPNAFATGRRTICVTQGILSLTDKQIEATLAHEFGHLSHKDTDLILVVSVGNLIVNAIVLAIRVIMWIVHTVGDLCAVFLGGSDGIGALFTNGLCHFLGTICISAFMWLWTKLGTILVMKSCRSNEYEADRFAFELGYGDELCQVLDSMEGESQTGLFAALAASHPGKNERIARLQELGAGYRAN